MHRPTDRIVHSSLFAFVVVDGVRSSIYHNMDPTLVSTSDLETFSEAWAKFDPDATNFIRIRDVTSLLLAVPQPLGLKGRTETRARQLAMQMHLKTHNGFVAFREVLVQLIEVNYFRSGDLNAQVPSRHGRQSHSDAAQKKGTKWDQKLGPL